MGVAKKPYVKEYLTYSLAFSLALHLSLAAITFLKRALSPSQELVEVTFVEPLSPSAQSEKQKNETRQVQLNDRTKQIIEQENSVNDEKPVKDAYLSQFNQRVERETRAREHGRYNNKPEVSKRGDPNANNQQQKTNKPIAKRMDKSSMGDLPLDSLKPQFNWDHINGPKGKLRADGRDLASAQTDDYIKDSELGMQTLLNTREFKYYSYYNRIKRQLSNYWEPKIKEKVEGMFRRGRKIASQEDRITRLLIELNAEGVLVGVKLVGESGVSDLDDAAIEAFREAAPFPNPPAGIIDPDGKVRIRWDFVLEA